MCRPGLRLASAGGAPERSRQTPPSLSAPGRACTSPQARPRHCLSGPGPCGLFPLLPRERSLGCLLRTQDVTRAWCRTQGLGNVVPDSGLWSWCRKVARQILGVHSQFPLFCVLPVHRPHLPRPALGHPSPACSPGACAPWAASLPLPSPDHTPYKPPYHPVQVDGG